MRTRWSVEGLSLLKCANRATLGNLATVAAIVGASCDECDRALFALLGRTPEEAFESLAAAHALEIAA